MDFPFDWPYMSPFMIPIVAIIGGITVAIVSTIAKGRVRELEIRERIAMIERGMVPPPESDPAGFERSLRTVESVQYRHSGTRHRSAGIVVMSVGFGLMLLIAFTSGEVNVGIGVGGFLVILGLGLFVVSLLGAPQPMPSNLPGPDRRPGNGPSPPGPADLR
jgi:Flp pilus assembly protein TadB